MPGQQFNFMNVNCILLFESTRMSYYHISKGFPYLLRVFRTQLSLKFFFKIHTPEIAQTKTNERRG